MKRSEMVKIINRELRAQSSGHCDICGSQLLSIMESFGMIPPPTTRTAKISYEQLNGFKWESEKDVDE